MEWGPEFWKQAGSDPCVHAAQRTSLRFSTLPGKGWCDGANTTWLRHLSHQLQDGQMAAKLCGSPHITVHGNSGNSKGKTS